MSWIKAAVGLILFFGALFYIVIPSAASVFTRFRLHATFISPLSVRGLEWRSKDRALHSLPTLRIERIFLSWGRCAPHSRFTINVEGITFRVHSKHDNARDEDSARKKRKSLPPVVQQVINRIVHPIAGYWSLFIRLFSVRIADVRIILEDLGGAEATIKEIHLRLGPEPTHPPDPQIFTRDEKPLTTSPRSTSPDVDAQPTGPRGRRSSSRLENIHRRASSIHSTVHSAVSKTASHLWSHATGNVVDRVTFSIAVDNAALVLPILHSGSPEASGIPSLTRRASSGSFVTSKLPSLGPLNSLLKLRPSTSDLRSDSRYERLVVVDGRSSVDFCVGFGPNRPILSPDNLRAVVEIGTVHASLEGIEKMRSLAKLRRSEQKKKDKVTTEHDDSHKTAWSHAGTPRVLLRAFEFATLSFAHLHVSHLLPEVSPALSSSSTDVSDETASGSHFTLSLDFTDVALQLSGCNSANNMQLAKLFGSNSSPSSLIHGITANLQWHSIELQCIAPGETLKDRSQLLAIRQAEFDVITTWRPEGWERQDLLFADDVNLAVLLARGNIASVDVAGDLQLCNELRQSWYHEHPPRPSQHHEPRSRIPIPPRIRLLLDIGPMSVVLADRASKDAATVNLATDGITVGGSSRYFDVSPSFRQDASTGAVGITVDPSATSPSSSTPEHTVGLRFDTYTSMEPISLQMSIGIRNEKTYRIAMIGRLEAKSSGDIYGNSSVHDDDMERHYLDRESLNADVAVTCETGVRIEMWNMDVLDALLQLANMKEPSPPKPHINLLDRLPSGLTFRLALGTLSVFIAHIDPNPHCDLRLIHGLWLQSNIIVNYACYKHAANMHRCRHMLHKDKRVPLGLYEDLTSKAFEYAYHLEELGGVAALFSVIISDTSIRPIFNGPRFISQGGTDATMPPEDRTIPPRPDVDQEYAAWGWSGSRRREPPQNRPTGEQVPGARSFIRIPHVYITGTMRREATDAPVNIGMQSRIERIQVNGQLPDVYCALLALQTIQKLGAAFKKPPATMDSQKPKPNIGLHILVQSIWVNFTFPLGEAVFFSISKLNMDREINKAPELAAEHVLLHVQSATNDGLWDELGRIKKLRVQCNLPDIVIAAKAFRLRIPCVFLLSQLILNINVCFKAVKLLRENLKTGVFHLERIPGAELPKHLPNFKFDIDLVHLEARDHPVENKINLNNRVGRAEQKNRIELEEFFEQKVQLLSNPEYQPSNNHLTQKASVDPLEAHWRFDWHLSRNWVRRIKKAREYERRREELMQRPFKISQDTKLPIHLLPLEQTTPLFRAALNKVKFNLSNPKATRAELIKYMGDVSSPFDDDAEFSLMVPFNIHWTMGETKVTLRDYPLPLLLIEPTVTNGPSWRIKTLFVIAEELPRTNVEDSCLFFPVEVLPAQCGHPDAKPLWVQVAKTVNPVKTYARPEISVYATEATKFTWCNSYSPGLTDVARVFDRLTSPPRDPSPKPGFWDKIRLSLHWQVRMTFTGSVRFFLKGSTDPYSIRGYGSGFALVLRRNVVVEIAQPNKEQELIQFMANELLISIPDLGHLHDAAAVGVDTDSPTVHGAADRELIEKRSRKPCARFLNGVRFGLGFKFERTCRPWTCTRGCGETENLLHRQCRFFDFKPHNTVTLRSPEAIERAEAEVQHPIDSYEAFRSDYIHFSVSLTAPRSPDASIPDIWVAENHSSLYLSPKAFAHFFNWWSLFSSKLPAPIRTGSAFPDAPPPTKKFGRSLATIKYGCDLRPVFVSHMYAQISEELWTAGRSEYLGVKMRTRRMRIDAHQRMQEKRDWNEQLNRVKVVTHKPFYAADVLLDDIQVVGIVADFDEAHSVPKAAARAPNLSKVPRVSEMPKDLRLWYNYFDFIDADRKPFDRNPRIEIVTLGDCPHVFLGRRIKAQAKMPELDDDQYSDMEASKFGHEHTHVCYLGAAKGIAAMQQQVAQNRINELLDLLENDPEKCAFGGSTSVEHRIATLNHHIKDLACGDRSHGNDDTNPHDAGDERRPPSIDDEGDLFQHTLHVHCPRLYFNNASRNVVYKYLYSRHNRQKEEYTTSHASIRGLRDGMKRRMERARSGLNRDDLGDDAQGEEAGLALIHSLERMVGSKTSAHFKLAPGFFSDEVDHHLPTIGIPTDCSVHPSWRALVIKPQISLRSAADDSAVILVAVEEISFQGFAIKDTAGLDPIAMDVLRRNYVALRGLQAFYPTKDVLMRTCAPQLETGRPSPDFLPLEVFLDVRSETTEYDRIVLKTDMSIQMDRFNHLRVPRGLEWPDATNDAGEPIEHLRKHQNATTVVCPMLTLSAKPNHYSALYYIVTDLLTYRDPQEEKRNDRINNFMYKFDQRDRDPQQLLATLFLMQQHIRSLSELQRGYETHLDQLTESGKVELFEIRTDLLHECDALFTVFEVINLNRAKDDARENAGTLSRIDIRAGNIAWHMLRDNGDPLVKFNIKHTLTSLENNRDGSTDSAMVIGDLQALNSNADAIFPEVVSRWDKDKSKTKKATPFVSVMLCLSEQVAGIGIIRSFSIFLHPVRIRLEQEVGTALTDYIFTDRDRERKRREESSSGADSKSHSTLSTLSANGKNGRPTSTLTTDNIETRPDEDAREMRQRAKANRTFVSIIVGSTSVVLDFKRDDRRKHHGLVWPECADFRFQAPNFEYHNEILTFKELFEKVKSDVWSSVWSQKGDLINQVFKKTSMFRSKKSLRQIAGISTDVPTWSGKRKSPQSPLRQTVPASTTESEADDSGSTTAPGPSGSTSASAIFRSLSRKSDTNAGRRTSIGSTKSTEHDDGHHGRGIVARLRKSKPDAMEVLADDDDESRPSSFDSSMRSSFASGSGSI